MFDCIVCGEGAASSTNDFCPQCKGLSFRERVANLAHAFRFLSEAEDFTGSEAWKGSDDELHDEIASLIEGMEEDIDARQSFIHALTLVCKDKTSTAPATA